MASRIFDSIRSLFSGSASNARGPARAGQRLVADGGTVFVVEEIRHGGMGIVYLCRFAGDTQEHGSRVALKTFDDRYFFDVTMADTFQREHTLWTLVSDVPFVLPLLGTFRIDKKPYLAMVVADGDGNGHVSLRDAIQASHGGLLPEHYLRAAFCVAIAMTKVSERVPGLVHGDIKPDNVLYVAGKPFLADFGLSGIANKAGRRGTPAYMAPELWSDDGRQSTATDVYAYGVMLAELLTGTAPLQAPKDDVLRWAAAHTKEPPRIELASNRPDLEVAKALKDVALRCLAKAPGDRPSGFAIIAKDISATIFAHDPLLFMSIVEATVQLRHFSDEHQLEIVGMRLRDLLHNNEVDAAVQLIGTLPEEGLKGELLLTVGSAWSLAGNDDRALEYFDRFLAEHPEAGARARCLNERGLSLKRLRRFDEARALYENLLVEAVGNDDLDLMVRTNYAGVLIENKEFESAISELQRVLIRHPYEATTLALMSWALQEVGRLGEAVAMIDHAIAVAPRNGNYHVMRADLLLMLRHVDDAMESVDRAYSLGFHSRRWLVLALATNMALDRKADVAGILASAQEQLPEAEVESVFRDAIEKLRTIANMDPSATHQHGREASAADAPEAVQPVPAPAAPEPSARKTPEDEEAETAARHRAIHSGETAHVQFRMSAVDGSYAIDFYLRPELSNYVEQFRSGYAQVKARFPGTPTYTERQERYRFARCQHCGFDVLTARGEGEEFRCQACDARGPVATVQSERLDALARECEVAIGRKARSETDGDVVLLVGFWITEDDVSSAVSQRMQAAGYRQADADCPAFVVFQQQMERRSSEAKGPPSQIWYRDQDREDGSQGETPRSLDSLLRNMRREIGPLYSASMEFPGNLARGVLANAEGRLALTREAVANDPGDSALKRALVVAELAAGNVDQAARITAAMEVASPDDPEALSASAHVAFSQGRHDDAIQKLERLLGMNARDQAARGLLIQVYNALGNKENAAEHIRAFKALGGAPDLFG